MKIHSRYGELIFNGPVTALRGATLVNAYLGGLDLTYTNFEYTNLKGADLAGADLSYANFNGANLEGADLHKATLRHTILHEANLRNTNLNGADLSRTLLCGATIDGARLEPSDIGGPGHILYALTEEEAEMIRLWRLGAAKEVELRS
jgi:uncharacterized protein YjbI with pentapeptide repeats